MRGYTLVSLGGFYCEDCYNELVMHEGYETDEFDIVANIETFAVECENCLEYIIEKDV